MDGASLRIAISAETRAMTAWTWATARPSRLRIPRPARRQTVLSGRERVGNNWESLRLPPRRAVCGTGDSLRPRRRRLLFSHEIFGHRVEGHRQRTRRRGQSVYEKHRASVLPTFLVDLLRPRPAEGRGRRSDGSTVRRRGMPGAEAGRCGQGRAADFLMSRSPVLQFDKFEWSRAAAAGFWKWFRDNPI